MRALGPDGSNTEPTTATVRSRTRSGPVLQSKSWGLFGIHRSVRVRTTHIRCRFCRLKHRKTRGSTTFTEVRVLIDFSLYGDAGIYECVTVSLGRAQGELSRLRPSDRNARTRGEDDGPVRRLLDSVPLSVLSDGHGRRDRAHGLNSAFDRIDRSQSFTP